MVMEQSTAVFQCASASGKLDRRSRRAVFGHGATNCPERRGSIVVRAAARGADVIACAATVSERASSAIEREPAQLVA